MVIGWGRTNNNKYDDGDRFEGGAHINILQKLEVPFIPNAKCRTDYKAFSNITSDKQVCAGGERGNVFDCILFLHFLKITCSIICLMFYKILHIIFNLLPFR